MAVNPAQGTCTRVHIIKTHQFICVKAVSISHENVQSSKGKKRRGVSSTVTLVSCFYAVCPGRDTTSSAKRSCKILWKRQQEKVAWHSPMALINPSAKALLISCGVVLLLVSEGGGHTGGSVPRVLRVVVALAGKPGRCTSVRAPLLQLASSKQSLLVAEREQGTCSALMAPASGGAEAMAEEPTQCTGLVKLLGLAGLPNSARGKNCVTMDKRLGPPSLVTKDSLHSSS